MRPSLAVTALVLFLVPALPQARADQANFVVDLPTDPSSLDPHVQWDPDSYAVYRNVFDNLLTRDPSGEDRAAGGERLALRGRYACGLHHPRRHRLP